MKLCKDCKHYAYESYTDHPLSGIYPAKCFHTCARESQTNIVTGEKFGNKKICADEREDALRLEEFRCGKEGKYWEPK